MWARGSILAAVVAAMLAVPGTGWAQQGDGRHRYEGDYYVDSDGRRMRVAFDPGNRMYLAGLISAQWLAGEGGYPAGAADVSGGAAFRFDFRLGCEDAESDCWKMEHRLLDVEGWGGRGTGGGRETGGARFAGTLYSGRYVRHLASPYIALPTSPPKKVLVPFDFGLALETAGVEMTPVSGSTLWDVDVIDARLVLELLRSDDLRNRLDLGVGVRYHILVRDSEEPLRPEHSLAPFTAALAALHLETKDGFHVLDLSAGFRRSWSDRLGWGQDVEVGLRYELVLAALNDNPISLVLDGGYRHSDPPARGLPDAEWAAGAGLAFSPQLD